MWDRAGVERVPLGPLSVSRVGLGCNNFGRRVDAARTREVVDAAIASGVTFFDTADIYGNRGGSERLLGELLRGRRDQVVLATKFGGDMGDGVEARGAPAYVRSAFAASLERLQTDHVDLLYYHFPDGVTPIAETIGAMADLLDAGQVRALGVSNFDVAQLDQAVAVAPIAALQNEYSLLARAPEREILPRCREVGVGLVPYYPLAAGLLSGKYSRGEPAPAGTRLSSAEEQGISAWATPKVEITAGAFDAIERLDAFAADHGHSLLELAIAALASQPGVASVIAGATSAEQVRANAAAGTWRLDAGELAELAAVAP
jgi:aryl-alcohol dehydrogenase-like predicted oxidoreductase